MAPSDGNDVEVSFVIPCLNEAETLERCIRKAQECIRSHGLGAEIIVADNGSTDGSQDIAERCGARVVPVSARGYGSALMGGFEAARGKYIIMGDGDDSYDFSAAYPFVERLREGYDLVMGTRLKGRIMPGAMPWKHRWIGNPVLTGIGRLLFRSPASDFHCGLRALTKDAFRRMDLRTTGMEFASEMAIKATLKGMRITEVPVTLYKDGRSRPPHLRSWRDGWRHLRFMLMYSPRWLFLFPGLMLMGLGLLIGAWLAGGPRTIGRVHLDVHTLLVAGLACVVGYQLVCFAVFAKVFAVTEGLLPENRTFQRLFRYVTLEVGVLVGSMIALLGFALLVAAFVVWARKDFGDLDYTRTMRLIIPSTILLVIGTQTVFSSFLLSILRLRRR